jgi:hypothetical protein
MPLRSLLTPPASRVFLMTRIRLALEQDRAARADRSHGAAGGPVKRRFHPAGIRRSSWSLERRVCLAPRVWGGSARERRLQNSPFGGNRKLCVKG